MVQNRRQVAGWRRTWRVVADPNAAVPDLWDDDTARLFVSGSGRDVALEAQPRLPDATAKAVAGGCIAPMPSKVLQVLVSTGESVTEGQSLVVLEAMKMETTLAAAEAGTVTEVRVGVGDQVDAGALLVVVDPG